MSHKPTPEELIRLADCQWTPPEDGVARLVSVRKRQTLVRAVGALAAIAVCVMVIWTVRGGTPPTGPGVASIDINENVLSNEVRFPDGTVVRKRTASTVLTEVPSGDDVSLVLEHGEAEFNVPYNATREWSVSAGNVRVQVLKATFGLSIEEEKVTVRSIVGTVTVSWNGREEEVFAGQSKSYPLGTPNDEPKLSMPITDRLVLDAGIVDSSIGITQTGPSRDSSSTRKRRDDWRDHAQAGRYDKAYSELSSTGQSKVRDTIDDLLLAADAARLTGHPLAASTYLEKVVMRFSDDPRASLAAFTQGNLLLRQLNQPSKAAMIFAKAGRLSGSEVLAQDALAREVEAWKKAGKDGEAKRAAERFVRMYPKGRRLRAVRKYGGLD